MVLDKSRDFNLDFPSQADFEAELVDLRTERDGFREELSKSRALVAQLTSLVEEQDSIIRDFQRQQRRLAQKKKRTTNDSAGQGIKEDVDKPAKKKNKEKSQESSSVEKEGGKTPLSAQKNNDTPSVNIKAGTSRAESVERTKKIEKSTNIREVKELKDEEGYTSNFNGTMLYRNLIL